MILLAFQTTEMRELTTTLESQKTEYLNLSRKYDSLKEELTQYLADDDFDRFQSYDLMILRETFEDKKKAYHQIQVTREQIKLREIYEESEKIPKGTVEYYQTYIEYYEQKLNVIRIRNGEYSYNKYKPVANHQISLAKEKIRKVEATA